MMSVAQQLFVVFFAIFWGTSSNAWPRWKPFNWPLVFSYWPVTRRVMLSIILLNVVPVIYFAAILVVLKGQDKGIEDWGACQWGLQAFRGVVPAFPVFGFYRIWMAIISLKPKLFYYNNETLPREIRLRDAKHDIEPTIEAIPVQHRWWWRELVVGVIYVLVGWLVAWFAK